MYKFASDKEISFNLNLKKQNIAIRGEIEGNKEAIEWDILHEKKHKKKSIRTATTNQTLSQEIWLLILDKNMIYHLCELSYPLNNSKNKGNSYVELPHCEAWFHSALLIILSLCFRMRCCDHNPTIYSLSFEEKVI